MAVTISPAMVRDVIDTRLTDAEIEGCIPTAIALYRNNLEGSSVPIAEDLETEIKRYLAAHYVSIKDRATKAAREELGEAEIEHAKNAGSSKTGLMSTEWGQTAVELDPTGQLGQLGRVPVDLSSLHDPYNVYGVSL
jgi:hypothetical protein